MKTIEKGISNDIFSQIENTSHEQVVYCQDKESGLKAIIAIHDTRLGPALGGVRMWKYSSSQDALSDALRLSQGMTFKAAISGLNLGGGKAVIIGDSNSMKNELLMRRFGRFIESLNGKFITAEDVGMTPIDMEYIRMETKHVVGVPEYLGGSGDPSPFTAQGVYLGIKASVKHLYGTDDLSGKKVAIQGMGHVGEELLKILIKEKMKIFVTDVNESKLAKISTQYKITAVLPEEIYECDADIFSPCALGAILNDTTIPKMKFKIVAGSANNQLKEEKKHSEALTQKEILYAPDFLINAGGLINVYSELNGYNSNRVYALVDKIYNVSLELFKNAGNTKTTTAIVARKMAEERINSISRLNLNK